MSQGNSLGSRSCVRQSKLYRQYESGNGVKAILGCDHLCWKTNVKEGAYKGQRVYDHEADNTVFGDRSTRRQQQFDDDNYTNRHAKSSTRIDDYDKRDHRRSQDYDTRQQQQHQYGTGRDGLPLSVKEAAAAFKQQYQIDSDRGGYMAKGYSDRQTDRYQDNYQEEVPSRFKSRQFQDTMDTDAYNSNRNYDKYDKGEQRKDTSMYQRESDSYYNPTARPAPLGPLVSSEGYSFDVENVGGHVIVRKNPSNPSNNFDKGVKQVPYEMEVRDRLRNSGSNGNLVDENSYVQGIPNMSEWRQKELVRNTRPW